MLAFEDLTDVRVEVECARGYQLIHVAGPLKGWVELEKRLRPQLPLSQLLFDLGPNRVIRDPQEAADVGRVVVYDLGVSLEDVHGVELVMRRERTCERLFAQFGHDENSSWFY